MWGGTQGQGVGRTGGVTAGVGAGAARLQDRTGQGGMIRLQTQIQGSDWRAPLCRLRLPSSLLVTSPMFLLTRLGLGSPASLVPDHLDQGDTAQGTTVTRPRGVLVMQGPSTVLPRIRVAVHGRQRPCPPELRAPGGVSPRDRHRRRESHSVQTDTQS